jgi:hypothetical protein
MPLKRQSNNVKTYPTIWFFARTIQGHPLT